MISAWEIIGWLILLALARIAYKGIVRDYWRVFRAYWVNRGYLPLVGEVWEGSGMHTYFITDRSPGFVWLTNYNPRSRAVMAKGSSWSETLDQFEARRKAERLAPVDRWDWDAE